MPTRNYFLYTSGVKLSTLGRKQVKSPHEVCSALHWFRGEYVMDNIFQAVHSKLVCTAVKLHTDLPRRKNKSKIFVCINYTYQVVQGPGYLKVLGPKPSVLQNLKITWVCTTLFKSLCMFTIPDIPPL